ncbi:hypothetical protein A3H03_03340 [Candidatus Kuenenbacteria bacterium RIFCSPLOWO2_12_FULL_42_13]|uniref:S23 ribosomal protein n=4 Tax=Candidatus Kueneniibacteriota TaxID=1752740 RepID=A0A0G0Z1J5_9BACT|nr:MAG: S23 ribosomal protein [Candidatus Kuenenbacteria bacterium GW2011_GWA2_42_15]OGG90041.1 MAG: hypothetical protein A3C68_00975 [Candidatus Kuenenbacteria bacterium RIFCSPHIGHO2_02_FULL_42_29]OGG91692.1 MAG: hypothetical protein A3H55_03465 [Candidatus Kuenenbacteria bacterium RIFCSPLOWO2_02_FULL_42_16]OGG92483.1 MAG: hypothetical protein A3H03_03340 [Candidatus Kuenenbacteria bacterium RIFCSPLOWO2_12_FULL_42_13]OGG99111.1 MAG: hypothetical protein A3E04_02245 [Candidatus Kuenenbacteria b
MAFITPPPPTNPIIIHKLTAIYKLWHEFLPHFSKTSRYTLGIKIDSLFIETTENIFIASHLTKDHKLPFLQKASSKLDMLKFFLQVAWEIKSFDNKKYITLSEQLDEIGRMLGGWQKQFLR